MQGDAPLCECGWWRVDYQNMTGRCDGIWRRGRDRNGNIARQARWRTSGRCFASTIVHAILKPISEKKNLKNKIINVRITEVRNLLENKVQSNISQLRCHGLDSCWRNFPERWSTKLAGVLRCGRRGRCILPFFGARSMVVAASTGARRTMRGGREWNTLRDYMVSIHRIERAREMLTFSSLMA